MSDGYVVFVFTCARFSFIKQVQSHLTKNLTHTHERSQRDTARASGARGSRIRRQRGCWRARFRRRWAAAVAEYYGGRAGAGCRHPPGRLLVDAQRPHCRRPADARKGRQGAARRGTGGGQGDRGAAGGRWAEEEQRMRPGWSDRGRRGSMDLSLMDDKHGLFAAVYEPQRRLAIAIVVCQFVIWQYHGLAILQRASFNETCTASTMVEMLSRSRR